MNHFFDASQIIDKIPDSDWLRFGILLLVLLTLLQAVRMISRINRYVLLSFLFIGMLGLFGSWVHNRNEPSFLTPVVDAVAPWFPRQLRSYDA